MNSNQRKPTLFLQQVFDDIPEENYNLMDDQTISEADFQLTYLNKREPKIKLNEALRKNQIRRQTTQQKGNQQLQILRNQHDLLIPPRTQIFNQESQDEQILSNSIRKISQDKFLVSHQIEEQNDNYQSALISNRQKTLSPRCRNRRSFFELTKQLTIISFIRKLQQFIKPGYAFQDKHFNLINDLGSGDLNQFLTQKPKSNLLKRASIHYKEIEKFRFFTKFIQNQFIKLKQFLKLFYYSIPLINPNNQLNFIWEVIITLIRLFFVFFVTIELTTEFDFTLIQIPATSLSIILIIDFFKRFFTIYYYQGMAVTDHIQIFVNQVSFHSIINFFSLVLLLLLVTKVPLSFVKYLLLFIIFQIKDVANFVQQTQESLNLSKTKQSLVQLGNLISILIFIIHLFACFWLKICQWEEYLGYENWLNGYDLMNQPWYSQYVESLYFTSVTMFTVGYGDFSPQSHLEKIICVLFMLFCTMQLSYIVNTVGGILTQLHESHQQLQHKMRILNQYMENKQISINLKTQIREYFNYYWRQEKIENQKEEIEIFDQLPRELFEQMMLEANTSTFHKSGLFKNTFSREFTERLLKQLQSTCIQPQIDIQLSRDEDFYLGIIESGSVKVYQNGESNPHQKVCINTLVSGDIIGYNQFIKEQWNENLSYQTSQFVRILFLSKQQFLQILADYPDDYEKYCMLKDSDLKITCLNCISSQHATKNCCQVHYIPEIEKTIKKHLYPIQNKRISFMRNIKRIKSFFTTYQDMELIQEAARIYNSYNCEEGDYFISQINSKVMSEQDNNNSVSLLINDYQEDNEPKKIQHKQTLDSKKMLKILVQ